MSRLIEKHCLPKAGAEKIDRSLWIWLWLRTLVSESLSCVCLDVTSGRAVNDALGSLMTGVSGCMSQKYTLDFIITPTHCSLIRTKVFFIC